MIDSPLISIIVPVYNVEEYIAECIDSILSQTFTDWELILVDDGSTDGSGKICDEYALKDKRIKVIHKENGGAALARNRGIDIATGNYITFIDGDDVLLNNNIYSKIITILKENISLDVIQYNVIHNWNSDKENVREYPFTTYFDKESITKAFLNEHIHFSCCDKVFKSYICKKVKFPECRICEDISIIPNWVENINKIKCCDIGFYGYRNNLNSTSKSVLTYDKICGMSEAYYQFLSYSYKYEKLRELTIKVYVGIIWGLFATIRRSHPQRIDEFCKNNFFIKLGFKGWFKICKQLPLMLKIKSFIACVLGPKWVFKFQTIFTRDN